MIRRLLHYSSPAARRLVRIELTLIVLTAVLQGLAFLVLVPVLRALLTGDLPGFGSWLTVLGAVGALTAIAHWCGSRIGMTAGTAVLDSVLERLGDRLVSLPIAWFGPDRSGLAAQIATHGAIFVSSAPYAILRPIITGFLTPATVLLGMVFLDWRLAVAMAISAPVMLLVFRRLRRSMEQDDRTHAAAVADASSRVIEFARLQPTLRTAKDRAISDALVSRALDDQHRAYRGLLLTGGAGIAAFAGVVQLALTAVIVLGTVLALGGTIEPATLIALLVLGVRFTEPIAQSGALGGGIAVANTTLDQLDELFRVPQLPEPRTPAVPADWGICFSGVTFGYGGGAVLRELDFEAPAGRMTAIVGPSGSGKSTITRLIARFYDPEAGTVSIGGRPLPELGSELVEGAVAPVFQDVYLFDDTILANVWLGAPELDREAVIAAATRARVDEIAARLPGGWDARVGEGGSRLSGGERQRVSIARALLKNSPIVLLDEATAALDIGNELAIGEALEAIRPDRTIVVVAHRLQTIRSADHIIMLDGRGGIGESGTHEELLAAGGAYARYWQDRLEAARWQLRSDPSPMSPARLDPEGTIS